jgi:hypothetical protein
VVAEAALLIADFSQELFESIAVLASNSSSETQRTVPAVRILVRLPVARLPEPAILPGAAFLSVSPATTQLQV